jgi:hypothetical protein
MLILEPPPELVGSGKFGTPCERMHAEKLIPTAASFDARLPRLLGLLEDPQPAIASTPHTTAGSTRIVFQARWTPLTAIASRYAAAGEPSSALEPILVLHPWMEMPAAHAPKATVMTATVVAC